MQNLTIKDIARLANVSVSTVSRSINNHKDISEETKNRVLSIIDEYNYVPNDNAKYLKQINSKNIAIIVKGNNHTLFIYIIEQIQKIISKKKYSIIISYIDNIDDELDQAKQIILEKKVKGIIFLGIDYKRFENRFSEITVPSVVVTTSTSKLNFDNLSSVSVDDFYGGFLAIDYLINKGHRKIAILCEDYVPNVPSGLRLDGAMKRLKESSIDNDEVLLIKGDFSMGKSYNKTLEAIEANEDFTAIFAMSDSMAIGAAKAIVDSQLKVPEDISIIGYNGTNICKFYNPSITTLRQPWEEMSVAAVEIIIDAIENNAKSKHVVSKLEIMEGGSVKQQ